MKTFVRFKHDNGKLLPSIQLAAAVNIRVGDHLVIRSSLLRRSVVEESIISRPEAILSFIPDPKVEATLILKIEELRDAINKPKSHIEALKEWIVGAIMQHINFLLYNKVTEIYYVDGSPVVVLEKDYEWYEKFA